MEDTTYGKAAIRLMRVERSPAGDSVSDCTIGIEVTGAFGAAYERGDNAAILPTDTMKNTVYALARDGAIEPPEEFAGRIGRHLLQAIPAASQVRVEIELRPWLRYDGQAFLGTSDERRTAAATVTSTEMEFEAGLEGLDLLRTGGSAFSGFRRDEFTTLAETEDRLLATAVSARWRYQPAPASCAAAFPAVRTAMLEAFAGRRSRSLQDTLFAMGESALAACPEVQDIHLSLANLHHHVVDLTPFGRDNPQLVFAPQGEPYGVIEGTVARSASRSRPATS